nr:hypothetical protein [uncultured Stenotrophomonas sp.]
MTAWRADARGNGAGVRAVQVLEGNIGHLRLSTFCLVDLAWPKLASSFALLADTDGVVLDLPASSAVAGAAPRICSMILCNCRTVIRSAFRTRSRTTCAPAAAGSAPVSRPILQAATFRRSSHGSCRCPRSRQDERTFATPPYRGPQAACLESRHPGSSRALRVNGLNEDPVDRQFRADRARDLRRAGGCA